MTKSTHIEENRIVDKKSMIHGMILLCFFFSGACALIYEVAWIRLLSLVFGSTVFALSTVLASFMGGLALGSFFFGKYSDKLVKNSGPSEDSKLLKLYAFLEAGIGIYCVFTPLIFKAVEIVYIKAYQDLSFYPFSILRFILSLSVLIIPTFFMGATLPVLSKYFIKNYQRMGKGVGNLYAINTFGAVLGVILAGYLLPTLIGIRLTIYITAATNMGIALSVLLLARLSASDSALPALNAVGQVAWSGKNPPEYPFTKGGPSETPPFSKRGAGGDFIRHKNKEGTAIKGQPVPSKEWHSIVILTAFGLAGLASMMYEVGWTRVLALILGSSTYAFSTMLVTFLTGIALGSFLFARLWGKRSVSLTLLGIVELAIGFAALIIAHLLGDLPYYFLRLFPTFGSNFGLIISLQFILCFLVMLIPTLLMGAAFPIASQLYTKNMSNLGGSIGKVYGANTFGCILGSFGAGFIFIPLTGVQTTLGLAILINTFIGIGLLVLEQKRFFLKVFCGCLSAILLCSLFWLPHWDKKIMASGVFIYAKHYNKQNKEKIAQHAQHLYNRKLLYYRDGANCTVSVVKVPTEEKHKVPYLIECYHDMVDPNGSSSEMLFLAVNGKVDASNNRGDMVNQLLLGYLPILLHPDPKNAFVLGLGSGVTAGAVAQYPLKEIDCAEIEPAVVDAARYFNKYNHNVLDDPRLNLIIADGRNHLQGTRKRYDIIISEPSNPWIAGISNLFTKEHFELCKKRLNPNGIMVQWVHTYSMSAHDFKMIVNTFRSAFPHSQLWFSSESDILLIGENEEIKIDYQIISERMARFPTISADLERFSLDHPASILGCFLLGEEDMQKFTAFSELNTDDLPLLEFSAPKNLYLYSLALKVNFDGLLRYKTSLLPPLINFEPDEFRTSDFFYHLGISYFDRGLTEEALKYLKQSAGIEPQNSHARIYLGRIYLSRGLFLNALNEFNAAINLNPVEADAYYYRGETYYRQRMFEEALSDIKRALEISPDENKFEQAKTHIVKEQKRSLAREQPRPQESHGADYYNERGISYARKGKGKEALMEFLMAERLEPKDFSVHMRLSNVYLSLGLYIKAVEELDTAIELRPRKAYAYFHRGKIYFEQQLLLHAIKDFQRAIEILPFEPVFRMGLAAAFIDMEQFVLAADQIEDVLRRGGSIDPVAWDNLAICYIEMKQCRRAIGVLKMALKMSPDSVDIRHHLAGAYFEQGDCQKAIETYLSVVGLKPDLLEAYLNLGICYHREGDYSQARRYLDKVLENDPYNQLAVAILNQLQVHGNGK